MAKKSKPLNRPLIYRQVGPYLGLGVQLAASALLCLFLGRWIDGKLGTEPVLMMVGVLVGAAAGFYSFIRKVLRLQDRERDSGRTEDKTTRRGTP